MHDNEEIYGVTERLERILLAALIVFACLAVAGMSLQVWIVVRESFGQSFDCRGLAVKPVHSFTENPIFGGFK